MNQVALTDKSSQKSSQKILVLLKAKPEMTIADLAMALVLTDRAIKKQLEKLKLSGQLRRVGPDKGGHWEVLA
jgi:ATP-dependent DNA helicase RecG